MGIIKTFYLNTSFVVTNAGTIAVGFKTRDVKGIETDQRVLKVVDLNPGDNIEVISWNAINLTANRGPLSLSMFFTGRVSSLVSTTFVQEEALTNIQAILKQPFKLKIEGDESFVGNYTNAVIGDNLATNMMYNLLNDD